MQTMWKANNRLKVFFLCVISCLIYTSESTSSNGTRSEDITGPKINSTVNEIDENRQNIERKTSEESKAKDPLLILRTKNSTENNSTDAEETRPDQSLTFLIKNQSALTGEGERDYQYEDDDTSEAGPESESSISLDTVEAGNLPESDSNPISLETIPFSAGEDGPETVEENTMIFADTSASKESKTESSEESPKKPSKESKKESSEESKKESSEESKKESSEESKKESSSSESKKIPILVCGAPGTHHLRGICPMRRVCVVGHGFGKCIVPVGPWGQWSQCQRSEGKATNCFQRRARRCYNCRRRQRKKCDTGGQDEWSAWSACGYGCNNTRAKSFHCKDEKQEERKPCPESEIKWSSWSSWGPGNGGKERHRTVTPKDCVHRGPIYMYQKRGRGVAIGGIAVGAVGLVGAAALLL